MDCKYCHQELPEGRSNRQYCSDAHKQAHYRQIHPVKPVQAEASIAELTEHVERLQSLLKIEQARNTELETENMRLTSRLDIEQRYYDSQPRNFRAWLRKQPRTDLIGRLLDRENLPLKGSRVLYEAHVRALRGPDTDMQEFSDMWRKMLLSTP